MVYNNPAIATAAPRPSAAPSSRKVSQKPTDPIAKKLEGIAMPGKEKLPPEFEKAKQAHPKNQDSALQQATSGQSREEVSQSAEASEAQQALAQTEEPRAQQQEAPQSTPVNQTLEGLRARLAELEKQKTPEARREYRRLTVEISEQEIAEANKLAAREREAHSAQQKEWEAQRIDQAVRDLLAANLEFLNPQRKSDPHAQLVQLPGWATTRQGKALSQLQQAMDERLSRDARQS